jgi:hypothetical protein
VMLLVDQFGRIYNTFFSWKNFLNT